LRSLILILAPISTFSVSSMSRSITLLLLLKGGLVGTVLNSADLLSLVLSMRSMSLSLFPGQDDVFSQPLDIDFCQVFLPDKLGDRVHVLRHFGQQDHGLDVVWNFNSVVPEFPKQGSDLVNSEGGIGVFGDGGLHDCFKVEVHGHNARLVVLACQLLPQLARGANHAILMSDGVVEAEPDVSYSLIV
jgi:hypothetical protein